MWGTGTQHPLGTATASGAAANYTGAAAYSPVILNPPPVPNPKPATNFQIQLQNGGVQGLSIIIPGSFFGFSVEFSVANQVRKLHHYHVWPIHANFAQLEKTGAIVDRSVAEDFLLTYIQHPHTGSISKLDGKSGATWWRSECTRRW